MAGRPHKGRSDYGVQDRFSNLPNLHPDSRSVIDEQGNFTYKDGARRTIQRSNANACTTSYYDAFKSNSFSALLDRDNDEMPELQPESDDECFDVRSEYDSSNDSGYDTDTFDERVPHDERPPHHDSSSEHESCEEIAFEDIPGCIPCQVCMKPHWLPHYNPRLRNCRDHCIHHLGAHALEPEPEAPAMPRAAVADGTALLLKAEPEAQLTHALTAEMFTDQRIHSTHREKEQPTGDLTNHLINWYSLVAKPIERNLWDSIPKARAAVDAEWAKLRAADGGRGTWDESQVQPRWKVEAEAKTKFAETGIHTHFGTLFDLCVEKHSELEEAKRKYKGRVVYGGHRVFDEFGLAAEFPDQGSGASFLTASKLCDAVSMLPGNRGEQSDAPSAYTQSKLGTGMKGRYETTWVELPLAYQPKAWIDSKIPRPCCPLRLSLYGHPMSGKYWENHFTEKVLSCGFRKMMGWECLFYHDELQLILSVYVDDFKLVGPSGNLTAGWKRLTDTGLELDPPAPLGDYLGCGQFHTKVSAVEAQRRLEQVHPLTEESITTHTPTECERGKPVRAIRYDMFGFFQQCIDVYLQHAGIQRSQLRAAKTPSVDDHQLTDEDRATPGVLEKDAAKVIMKMLYGARLVRYELLWPICSIARMVSKWSKAEDKRLYRLICYLNTTLDHTLESFVGDAAHCCHVILYTDADFAGDTQTSKSTSGCYIAIAGPNTFAPITAMCKKQNCVSHSSTESEIVAAEYAVRTEGLQILTFWEHVVHMYNRKRDGPPRPPQSTPTKGEPRLITDGSDLDFNPRRYHAYTRPANLVTELIIAEDNEAVIKIIRKCRSTALRHLPRTHRIDVYWLFEVCNSPEVRLKYCNTKQQIADLMTKALNSPPVWQYLIDLAQIRAGPLPSATQGTTTNTTPPTTTTTTTKPLAIKTYATAYSLHYNGNCIECGAMPYNGSCFCNWD